MITNTKMASLWNKFRDRKFRDAFVASQFKRSIPFQIAALRKKLGFSQEQLGDAAKLTQGVVSRAENPNYGNLTFNTVLRIANGLDVAVIIEFVPFSRLLQVFESRSQDLAPMTFEAEDKALATAIATGGQVEEQAAAAILPKRVLQPDPEERPIVKRPPMVSLEQQQVTSRAVPTRDPQPKLSRVGGLSQWSMSL